MLIGKSNNNSLYTQSIHGKSGYKANSYLTFGEMSQELPDGDFAKDDSGRKGSVKKKFGKIGSTILQGPRKLWQEIEENRSLSKLTKYLSEFDKACNKEDLFSRDPNKCIQIVNDVGRATPFPQIQREFLMRKNKDGNTTVINAMRNDYAKVGIAVVDMAIDLSNPNIHPEVKDSDLEKIQEIQKEFYFQKDNNGDTPYKRALNFNYISYPVAARLVDLLGKLDKETQKKEILPAFIKAVSNDNIQAGRKLLGLAAELNDSEFEKTFVSSFCSVLGNDIKEYCWRSKTEQELVSEFLIYATKVVPDKVAELKIPRYFTNYNEIIKRLNENLSK